jgi:cation transporter-like permease
VVDLANYQGTIGATSFKGSIFADDSTLLVDAVSGTIVGPVVGNITGNLTGNVVGNVTGNLTGNSSNSFVEIEQNQVRGEYENSNHQFMKDLEFGVIPNNTNYQSTIVQNSTENQKSNSSYKIPAVATKCKGETFEFENENDKAVVLALFIPLIVSSGGNSGSQASTLIIRALALGEITIADWWRIMRKEIVTGFYLGLILGVIGFSRVTTWHFFTDIYGPHWMLIALTIGIAVFFVVMWGSIMGSMMPLLLKRLGLDPATSSAPFIATMVDVTGLVIYFSFASLLLRGTLL